MIWQWQCHIITKELLLSIAALETRVPVYTMTTSTTMLVMMGNYSGSHHLTNTVKRYDCQLQTLSEDPFQQ